MMDRRRQSQPRSEIADHVGASLAKNVPLSTVNAA